MSATPSRAEVVALLALAQDLALGQPLGSQLRAVALAQALSVRAGAGPAEQATVWWASSLRFLGCTGHAFDMAVVFGAEIAMRADTAETDFANPVEVLAAMLAHAGSGKPGLARLRSMVSIMAGGKKAAELNFRTACEVADVLAKRLGLDETVLGALRFSFERWNGRGLPTGAKGASIPRAMRVSQLAQEFEVLARIEGAQRAIEIVRKRRGSTYDPFLADYVVADGPKWWGDVEPADPWELALATAPATAPLDGEPPHESLLVLADFADLKSPWLGGHSRAVATLARAAAGPQAEAAALVHDLGRVSVPNSIWDKPGPLTRGERDRVEAHSLVTDQLLRRLPYMARLADAACGAHERLDRSGYHRRAGGADLDHDQRVIAAADCYQAMTSDRPYRLALTTERAATELRAMSADGRLDGPAVEEVLVAAGHRRAARPTHPGGLSAREAEVLRLLALGMTTAQIARDLAISTKTADHHVQHIYLKTGVSTRGAATLFAIENGVLTIDG
jgi:HD-GYP domain-containing protein (c-di-GMP phosphodiesterase class II)